MLVQETADDDEDENHAEGFRRSKSRATQLEARTQTHSPQDFQSKFCATLRAMVVTHKLTRRYFKKCCIKDRVLGDVYEANQESLYIHNVLKLLRVMEGVMKEKLEISKKEWRKHWVKFGPLRIVESSDQDEEKESSRKKKLQIEIEQDSEKNQFSDQMDVASPKQIELEMMVNNGVSLPEQQGKCKTT